MKEDLLYVASLAFSGAVFYALQQTTRSNIKYSAFLATDDSVMVRMIYAQCLVIFFLSVSRLPALLSLPAASTP